MSIKKKIGLGVASAALGLSLVGGGTWAAFNDTATMNNYFAAGTLDLEVGKNHPSHTMNFDLANMKPGDTVRRIFKLNNTGSLAIKEVLLNVTASDFVDGNGENSENNEAMLEFLSQFVVTISTDNESPQHQPRLAALNSGVTLADLINMDQNDTLFSSSVKTNLRASDGTNRINLVPLTVPEGSDRRGLPADPRDSDPVFIQISFNPDNTRVDGPYSAMVQNKFQGDSAKFFFNFEATQWDGVRVGTPNKNGEINNAVQDSADGSNMPDPITKGNGIYDGNEVIDENNIK
ncbi:TasA family protein [Sutcliffiella cohnii]